MGYKSVYFGLHVLKLWGGRMPSFKLQRNQRNEEIVQCIKRLEDGIVTKQRKNSILVDFKYGLNLSRLEMASVLRDLTESEWFSLQRGIKATLKGAKMRVANDFAMVVRPLLTEEVHVRFSPIELHEIEEAANLTGKTLSDFIRGKALEGAGEEIEKAAQKATAAAMKSGTYVS